MRTSKYGMSNRSRQQENGSFSFPPTRSDSPSGSSVALKTIPARVSVSSDATARESDSSGESEDAFHLLPAARNDTPRSSGLEVNVGTRNASIANARIFNSSVATVSIDTTTTTASEAVNPEVPVRNPARLSFAPSSIYSSLDDFAGTGPVVAEIKPVTAADAERERWIRNFDAAQPNGPLSVHDPYYRKLRDDFRKEQAAKVTEVGQRRDKPVDGKKERCIAMILVSDAFHLHRDLVKQSPRLQKICGGLNKIPTAITKKAKGMFASKNKLSAVKA